MRHALGRIAKGETSEAFPPPSITFRPGLHRVREWNGRTCQIEVPEKGFRMEGKTWQPLSALVRHITGTNWSGPVFFGVQRCDGIGCAIYTRKSSEGGPDHEV